MHRVNRATTVFLLVAAVMAGMIVSALPAAATGGVFITNGTVMLGVHSEAHLNVRGGPRSLGGTTTVGLRFVPTGAEATAPGCTCEGWGAADAISGVTGYANDSVDGIVNITPVSFATTASTAVSLVRIGSTLEVTHDYHPSVSPNLYEAIVTIKNISAGTVRPLYRRVMDWDIEPTPFSEFVTIIPGNPTALLYDSNDGFQSANPLAPRTDLGFTGQFIDEGPSDHGAMFDFGFPDLAPNASRTFKIYYGAAGNEIDALNAIVAVGAETISLGQANVPNGPSQGIPNTFIFAFAGIGGSVFCAGAPIPTGFTLPRAAKAVADRLFCDTLAALQLRLPIPIPRFPAPSSLGTTSVRPAPHPKNRAGSTGTGITPAPTGGTGLSSSTVSGSTTSLGGGAVRMAAPRKAAVRKAAVRPARVTPAKRSKAVRSVVLKPVRTKRTIRVEDLGAGFLAAMAGRSRT